MPVTQRAVLEGWARAAAAEQSIDNPRLKHTEKQSEQPELDLFSVARQTAILMVLFCSIHMNNLAMNSHWLIIVT